MVIFIVEIANIINRKLYIIKNFVIRAGLLPSEKLFYCLNENTLKMLKNAFYFIFKYLFALKIFKFLS